MTTENQRSRFLSSRIAGRSGKRIRVMIVECHALVRRGLAATVNAEDDMVCCGEFAMCEEAFRALATTPADVVIVNVSALRRTGIEAIQRIRKQTTPPRIVAVAMSERPEVTERLANAGAAALVMSTGFIERLQQAIRRGLSAKQPASDAAADRGGARREVVHGGFDAVERQIVAMIGQGVPNREIAIALGLSLAMVEVYRRRIWSKMNQPAPTQLVEFCCRWSARAGGAERKDGSGPTSSSAEVVRDLGR